MIERCMRDIAIAINVLAMPVFLFGAFIGNGRLALAAVPVLFLAMVISMLGFFGVFARIDKKIQ